MNLRKFLNGLRPAVRAEVAPEAAPEASRWVRLPSAPEAQVECLDGVAWWDAPVPGVLHQCRAQMRGTLESHLPGDADPHLTYVERCACGATKLGLGDGALWLERNQVREHPAGEMGD